MKEKEYKGSKYKSIVTELDRICDKLSAQPCRISSGRPHEVVNLKNPSRERKGGKLIHMF